jgi:tRNA-binding EMAP/Myf-like protein
MSAVSKQVLTKLPKGVVLGHVLKVSKHPKADRLKLCRVALSPSIQTQQETVQIVCGAPNVAERQLVPVATVGTLLPLPTEEPEKEEIKLEAGVKDSTSSAAKENKKKEFKIKKSKLRGEVSMGMIW